MNAQTINQNSALGQTSFFLDHFDLARRSLIANQFHSAVREGASDVDAVIRSVKADALRRTLIESDAERVATQKQVLELLAGEEVRRYAQEVLDRESLPAEVKQKLKADRSEQYRHEYMKAQKPTERQIRFLKSLGCPVLPENRFEASQMIDGHING